ncbi:hypothetical protein ABW21_db0209768 [Orbilia brochopaga]|nr:hypothetical protein ABW21_db0209768 [Drechslerella brochopaga]
MYCGCIYHSTSSSPTCMHSSYICMYRCQSRVSIELTQSPTIAIADRLQVGSAIHRYTVGTRTLDTITWNQCCNNYQEFQRSRSVQQMELSGNFVSRVDTAVKVAAWEG